MTEFYNKYIIPHFTNLSNWEQSKIAFITTPYGDVIYKRLFYVKFENGEDGFFFMIKIII